MSRNISKKAKSMYRRLCNETKKQNDFCKQEAARGRTDGWFTPDEWTWANSPIEGERETYNALKDMEKLVLADYNHIQRCVKLDIVPHISLAECKIIMQLISDRLKTYTE